jgi:hypothetical protein
MVGDQREAGKQLVGSTEILLQPLVYEREVQWEERTYEKELYLNNEADVMMVIAAFIIRDVRLMNPDVVRADYEMDIDVASGC